MRRGIFTKNRKDVLKRRSNSDLTQEEISNSWSTDPRDLPKGIPVGSMSVPYPPPYYVKASEAEDSTVRRKKDSKKTKKRPTSVHQIMPKTKSDQQLAPAKKFWQRHRRTASDTPPLEFIPVRHSPSPPPSQLLQQQEAEMPDYPAATAEEEVPPQKPARVKVKLNDSLPLALKIDEPPDKPARMRVKVNDKWDQNQNESLRRTNISRSCSLDALNDIGDEKDKLSKERRGSFEGSPEESRPHYNRWLSYNTPPAKSRTAVTSRSRLYKKPTKGGDSPSLSKKDNSQNSLNRLLRPRSIENLMEVINSGADVNALNEEGDAVIHNILKKKRKDKLDMLLTLLINSDADVNRQNWKGNTALHIAIEEGEVMCIKALIVFGADINKPGSNEFTPFDLVINNGHLSEVETLFMELRAKGSAQLLKQKVAAKVPRMHSFAENMRPLGGQKKLGPNDKLQDFINKQGMRRLQQELQNAIDRRHSMSGSFEVDMYEAFALFEQQKELTKYNKTLKQASGLNTNFSLEGGSRILFLDGGGIKGLVQLEILMQIEEATGRTVVELFDWIVGTSTGGVIALALVYGKKSLSNLRQLYFKLKDRIFTKARYGFGYNSEALDEILQEYLDPDIKMTDVSHPKVLVAAVNKATTNLHLHFFNNCFGNEYCDFPVWKVARYTSAAPMFFTEMDNYVDGGVICNNPTEFGLTEIQNFCRQQGVKLPIAVVVSIGSGRYPAKEMGIVDAQDALFFGKQWLRPGKLIKKTQNLFSLLSNALVESEMVATNSESRCLEQNIPFFRFSPDLDEIIAAGETDNEKLFSMIIQTKIDTRSQRLEDLIKLFYQIAEVNSSPLHQSIPEEAIEEDIEPQPSSPPPALLVSQRDRETSPPLLFNRNMNECPAGVSPLATSSPDRNTERRNLNLMPPDPSSIEQSILSDIQEESYQSTLHSSSLSSENLLASSPTSPTPLQLEREEQPFLASGKELTESKDEHISSRTPKERSLSSTLSATSEMEDSQSCEADLQRNNQEPMVTSSLSNTEPPQLPNKSSADTEPPQPSNKSSADTEPPQPSNKSSADTEPPQLPNKSSADTEPPQPPNKSSADSDLTPHEPKEQPLVDSQLVDDYNKQPADPTEQPTDQQPDLTDEPAGFTEDSPQPDAIPAVIVDEARPCSDEDNQLGDSQSTKWLEESQGFSTFAEKVEQDLKSYLVSVGPAETTQLRRDEPDQNHQSLVNEQGSENSSSGEQSAQEPVALHPTPDHSLSSGRTIKPESIPTSELPLLAEKTLLIPADISPKQKEPEHTPDPECVESEDSPGDQSPEHPDVPGPFEQSLTTATFSLIEQQYIQISEELSTLESLKSSHLSSGNQPFKEDQTSSLNGTIEPLNPSTVADRNMSPESATLNEPQSSASSSEGSCNSPVAVRVTSASVGETSPGPVQAVHPSSFSDEQSTVRDDFSGTGEADRTDSSSPDSSARTHNGHKPYIVDQVSQLGEGEREKDLCISYQSFAKQYRVEADKDNKAMKNKPKPKASHFKLQTKVSSDKKRKSKRETTI